MRKGSVRTPRRPIHAEPLVVDENADYAFLKNNIVSRINNEPTFRLPE